MIKILLLLTTLISTICVSAEADLLSISDIKYISLDKDSSVDIAAEFLEKNEFLVYDEVAHNPQYSDKKLWTYINVINTSKTESFVSLLYPLFEELKVYKRDQSGEFREIDKELMRKDAFMVSQSAEYLISTLSYNILGIGFLKDTREQYQNKLEIKKITISALTAVFIVFLIYNFLLFIILGDVSYFFFFFFVLVNAMSLLIVADSIAFFGDILPEDFYKYSVFVRPLFPFSAGLFVSSLLFVGDNRYCASHKLLLVMNSVLIFFSVLASLDSMRLFVAALWDPVFIIYAFLLVVIGFREGCKGVVGAWPVFISQIAFITGIIMFLLAIMGVIDYSVLTPFYVLFGLVTQIALMSLTLAANVSAQRVAKLETEIKIQAQAENEENLKYLLRIIHHDINNALHIILNASFIARKKNPENKMLEKISNAAKIIKDLIKSARDYEKNMENEEELYLSATSLRGLFDKLKILFHDRAKEKGVNLKIMSPLNSDLFVLANESMILNEVLANFVSNAIKFSPRGSNVTLRCEDYDDGVTIAIEDQGIGMSKKLLEDLLSGRSVASLKGTQGEQGDGYGVRIALKTIKSFMGKIRIQSVLNDGNNEEFGTKVYIELRKM